jgi:colicin import membrane protein
MSTLSETTTLPTTPPADDPFRYGWRYIQHKHPDGQVEHERVSLSLYDVLHSQEEDFIVRSHNHDPICT